MFGRRGGVRVWVRHMNFSAFWGSNSRALGLKNSSHLIKYPFLRLTKPQFGAKFVAKIPRNPQKSPERGQRKCSRATLMPVSHSRPLLSSPSRHCYLHNERMFGATSSLGINNAGRGPFTCWDMKSCLLETSKKRERRMMGRPPSASGGEFPSPPLYLVLK